MKSINPSAHDLEAEIDLGKCRYSNLGFRCANWMRGWSRKTEARQNAFLKRAHIGGVMRIVMRQSAEMQKRVGEEICKLALLRMSVGGGLACYSLSRDRNVAQEAIRDLLGRRRKCQDIGRQVELAELSIECVHGGVIADSQSDRSVPAGDLRYRITHPRGDAQLPRRDVLRVNNVDPDSRTRHCMDYVGSTLLRTRFGRPGGRSGFVEM